jgi:hypothetical protein
MSKESKETSPPATDPADAGQPTGDKNTKTRTSKKPNQWSRRDRGNRNNNNNNNNCKKPVTYKEPKFEGRCAELKGEIYDGTDFRQADGYTKTTKEIAEYVGRVYSGDARTTVESLVLPVFIYPSDPAEDATETEKRKSQKRVDSTVVKEDRFEEDLKKVFPHMGTMYRRSTSEAGGQGQLLYLQMKVDYDTIELLKSIKDCVFKLSSQKYGHHARLEALRKFVNMHQDKNNNSQEYYQGYRNQVEVAEHCGVDVGINAEAIEETLQAMGLTTETATPDQLSVAKEVQREEYLACAFILGADRKRYGKLVEDTENAFIQKDDKYPKTLVKAYNLLLHWKQDPKNLMQVLGSTSDGVAFTNLGDDAKPKKTAHTSCVTIVEKRVTTQVTAQKSDRSRGRYLSTCPGWRRMTTRTTNCWDLNSFNKEKAYKK